MSVGGAFKKIGRGLSRSFGTIARLFRKLFLVLFGREALTSFQRAARRMLATQLGRIAWAAVEALASLKLPNEEKRRRAFAHIAAEAHAAGLTVKDSLINLLIEMAVQRLKGLLPPDEPESGGPRETA